MGKKIKLQKGGLRECPTGKHLVWWPVTATAECPWCVIADYKEGMRQIIELAEGYKL